MKNQTFNTLKLASVLPAVVIAALLILPGAALAQADLAAKSLKNPGIIPPQGVPKGTSYSEWTARWWQWALASPVDTSPLVDESGAYAAQGQSGSVWFLAGVFNDTGVAERTVVLPPGKTLFFPILNNIWISTEPTDPQTADTIRPLIKPIVDHATDLACEIDGVSVRNIQQYRTESPLFNVTLPANNVFGIGAGTYGPSLDEGFYLMLAPLSAGSHTIHFHGTFPDNPFTLDITYHLLVASR